MSSDYPNPWNFSNIDKNLLSPNGKYKIEFGELYEMAMGAPIAGECYLIFDDKKIKINEWTGGPVIWNETSGKIALPIWTKNRNQKISIVDINNLTITTYKKEFRVLHFNKFEENKLSGIDSPFYMTTKLNFDINKEEVETIKQIKYKTSE
ncbi:hypothetical protein [Arcicella rosea]|uniref:Uncharacterized protein n=1 Tax=Arcicella rosea TaxID=502909 RepID=A0A841ELE8_9BACT|nr:hypothetical protein [Arcicella rosea]MBB6004025.1 hypothetical protein [Arcicella rosea]